MAPVVVTADELDRWRRGIFHGPADRAKRIAAILGAFNDGESPRLIAQRIRRDERTVTDLLRKAGVPGFASTAVQRDRGRDAVMAAQRASGWTLKRIAEAHGLTAGRVGDLLRRIDREAETGWDDPLGNAAREQAKRVDHVAREKEMREAVRARIAKRREVLIARAYRYLRWVLRRPVEVTSQSQVTSTPPRSAGPSPGTP